VFSVQQEQISQCEVTKKLIGSTAHGLISSETNRAFRRFELK